MAVSLEKVGEIVDDLLQQHEAVSKKAEHDEAMSHQLVVACAQADLANAISALENKADVNAPDQLWGLTPLLWAAGSNRKDNVALVELLLDKRAEMNTKDLCGNSALFLALNQGNKKIVKLLSEAGAEDIRYHKIVT
jgi:ankyrin repeat protein